MPLFAGGCEGLTSNFQGMELLVAAKHYESDTLFAAVAFFPYGIEHGDERYDFNSSTPDPQFELDPPMVYYSSSQTNVYVSEFLCVCEKQTAQLYHF